MYDTHLGQFLNADPIILDEQNSQNYALYSYVLNNPLKYTDPSGYTQQGGPASAAIIGQTGNMVQMQLLEMNNNINAIKEGAAQPFFLISDLMNDDKNASGTVSSGDGPKKPDPSQSKGPVSSGSKASSFQYKGTTYTFYQVDFGAKVGSAANYTNRVGDLDIIGYIVDGFGNAAESTSKITYKYGQRLNNVVVGAAQLTSENAATWAKISIRLNAAGGVIGVVDCGMQSFDDFANENYWLGSYEAAKAASYSTGTIMLFTPLAPIGAATLLGTGLIDMTGDVVIYLYGRNK
ncbi:MAG: hypothetical protein FGM41_06110 [Bacteroidetes bacterium]|nr:hypothetical protein [Bacteroidota bacterium]